MIFASSERRTIPGPTAATSTHAKKKKHPGSARKATLLAAQITIFPLESSRGDLGGIHFWIYRTARDNTDTSTKRLITNQANRAVGTTVQWITTNDVENKI